MIKMPKFLCEEIQEYLNLLYELKKKDRILQSQKVISITRWTEGQKPQA